MSFFRTWARSFDYIHCKRMGGTPQPHRSLQSCCPLFVGRSGHSGQPPKRKNVGSESSVSSFVAPDRSKLRRQGELGSGGRVGSRKPTSFPQSGEPFPAGHCERRLAIQQNLGPKMGGGDVGLPQGWRRIYSSSASNWTSSEPWFSSRRRRSRTQTAAKAKGEGQGHIRGLKSAAVHVNEEETG